MVQWLIVIFAVVILPLARSQRTLPPVLPLAVRSPYLNTWTRGPNVNFTWSRFWNADPQGWVGMIRIDSHSYQWLGGPSTFPTPANVTDISITPTQTIITYVAGPAEIRVTFLSPIEVADSVRQSMPFAYVALEFNFTDNAEHDVQVYNDISGEFLTNDVSKVITWSTHMTESSSFHQIQRNDDTFQQFTEAEGDLAEDIIMFLATQSGPDVSAVVCTGVDCREEFSDKGTVTWSSLTPPMNMGNPFPVFAIVRDLGVITAMSSPMVWAIGAYRNPSISFITSTEEKQIRAPLFAASYSSISEVVDAFVSDYSNAKNRADDLDNRILNSTSNVTDSYYLLEALAARQAMAATELTISNGSDGQWNMSDLKMFMKDVGNSKRMNPVENIYAAFPLFLFINSTYAGQLLSPLLEFQDDPRNKQAYAARDIGQSYPKADGPNTQHSQGVEHTASMLIMLLAHARVSGDGSLIARHYSLLRKWGDYLVNSTMDPPDLTTVDGNAQTNSTNLVLKGIIALQAMATISIAVDQPDDADRYSQFASIFISQWRSLARSRDGSHLLLQLGEDQASWAEIYNLYADRLLGTNLVGDDIYQAQAQFYQTQLSQSAFQFNGLPIDSSDGSIVNAAWTSFVAATVAGTSVQQSLIMPVFTRALNSSQPPAVEYGVDGSESPPHGAASPAMGAMFAPLALMLPVQQLVAPFSARPEIPNTSLHHSIIGPVIGVVIGGIVFIVLIIAVLILWRRRQRLPVPRMEEVVKPFTKQVETSAIPLTLSGQHHPPGLTPYPLHPFDQFESMTPKGRHVMNNGSSMNSQCINAAQTHNVPVSAPSGSSPGRSSEPRSQSNVNMQPSREEMRRLREEVKALRRIIQEVHHDNIGAPPTYASDP